MCPSPGRARCAGLFFGSEPTRYILHIKRYNDSGSSTARCHSRAVTHHPPPKNEAQAIPIREAILNALEMADYWVDWKLLNASDFGIPQSRIRVFVVAIRRDSMFYTFRWPEPQPLSVKVSDLLDAPDVAERVLKESDLTRTTKAIRKGMAGSREGGTKPMGR